MTTHFQHHLFLKNLHDVSYVQEEKKKKATNVCYHAASKSLGGRDCIITPALDAFLGNSFPALHWPQGCLPLLGPVLCRPHQMWPLPFRPLVGWFLFPY